MGTEQSRFPLQPEMAPVQRRKRWGGCWGGLPCFSTQKNGKRIVPASRMPEPNASSNGLNRHPNGVLASHATTIVPSLLAPPSSPASFSNSALPSTAQSPSCFLSDNSPERPSAFATGPYAHETQLVSPPVFSTFTTEPSTAPLTPPPELAHLTTPSSPDVPFARFLSSSMNLKGIEKNNFICKNDLQSSYSPYTGSPASTLRSPISRTSADFQSSSFPEHEFCSHDGKYSKSDSERLTGIETSGACKTHDSNFFCPATFAQFYLDNPPFPHSGGRLSVSKESDVCSNGGNGYQSWQNNKTSKQDGDEVEAYRASFGFSADEIITTPQYVEISNVMDNSFTNESEKEHKAEEMHINLLEQKDSSLVLKPEKVPGSEDNYEGHTSRSRLMNISAQSTPGNQILKDNIFSWKETSRNSRKYRGGLSSSDAEVDYRRGRSFRERNAITPEWRN